MTMRIYYCLLFCSLFTCNQLQAQSDFELHEDGYFTKQGLDITVFTDIYPVGHQTGVTVIQHGSRVAANGDVRLEHSPGQWSPVPKAGKRIHDTVNNTITQRLWYPDSSKNRKGFNPIIYPDLNMHYDVSVTPLEGNSFKISVHIDEPLPSSWVGKAGFHLELFPGHLFGKSYLMDEESGTFPLQADGPVIKGVADTGYVAKPLSEGKKLTVAPEEPLQRMHITSNTGTLELVDGRSNHQNGWYIVRENIPKNATDNAIEWVITPHVEEDWQYEPVIHISQVGYHPDQQKTAVIELDNTDDKQESVKLYRITPEGEKLVMTEKAEKWGPFLRYNYLTADFTSIHKPGMYQLRYGNSTSNVFKIADDIYDRHVWQPTLEYFLPVQMCHMRVNDRYRIWHGHCHGDDALMAPLDTNHFDGYKQGSSTLTSFDPGEHVPGLDKGGWHDAGDYDLRVESQIGTIWMLSLMVEEFGLDYDATTIDQEKQLVEIQMPDGKSDAIQQIEHGLASVLGAYRSMGRLYRGIICSDLRQYVMLGDGAIMTDQLIHNPDLKKDEVEGKYSGKADDRWVFTEDNPQRELYVAAGLAAASRALKKANPSLAEECLITARALWAQAEGREGNTKEKIIALAELILATDDQKLKQRLVEMKAEVIDNIAESGWEVGHVIHMIKDESFQNDVAQAVNEYRDTLRYEAEKTPFGVPYEPNIWGAGWTLQRFGMEQYFFDKGWSDPLFQEFYTNALHFVLGAHPGQNTKSFASGVGTNSVTTAYGINRADWSFIPGGVVSGTALIRPNLPELKEWPFFWSQSEYVMGGGATHYMFLVLAVQQHLQDTTQDK